MVYCFVCDVLWLIGWEFDWMMVEDVIVLGFLYWVVIVESVKFGFDL